jgi:hypothetical protein
MSMSVCTQCGSAVGTAKTAYGASQVGSIRTFFRVGT